MLHLQSHGIGRTRSQTSFLSMSSLLPATYISSLKYHKKHNEQLCEKRRQELVTLGGGSMVHLLVYPVSLLFIQMNRKLVIYAWMIQNMQEGHLRKCTGNYRMSVVELLLIISGIILC